MKRSLTILIAPPAGACSPVKAPPPTETTPAPPPARELTLTIVGTNDLHGHIESLPLLGGFLRALRERRGAEGVLLLDAGDMFQGTLESNLGEGRPSCADTTRSDTTMRRSAITESLRARSAACRDGDEQGRTMRAARSRHARPEARFPFLSANLVDKSTGRAPDWKNVHGHTIVVRQGI